MVNGFAMLHLHADIDIKVENVDRFSAQENHRLEFIL